MDSRKEEMNKCTIEQMKQETNEINLMDARNLNNL